MSTPLSENVQIGPNFPFSLTGVILVLQGLRCECVQFGVNLASGLDITLPMYRRGHGRFSRLFGLNEWLLSWCKDQKLLFVNNWNLFWERPRLFRADGLHPSRVGAELLSDNISRTLRSIWLVNNCYDDFCSTHLNDRSTCSVQSINCVCSPNSEFKIYI